MSTNKGIARPMPSTSHSVAQLCHIRPRLILRSAGSVSRWREDHVVSGESKTRKCGQRSFPAF